MHVGAPRSSEHINVLKLKLIHLTVKGLLPFLHHKHVLVGTDTVSTVNHQGDTGSLRCLQVKRGTTDMGMTSLKAATFCRGQGLS